MPSDSTHKNTAVLIADDHAVSRRGLVALIKDQLGIAHTLEAENLPDAIDLISDERLVLAVVDLRMPGVSSAADIGQIRELRPNLPLAIISGSDDRNDMLECLAAGVHGYILKSTPEKDIVSALIQIMSGQVHVPPSLAETVPPSADTEAAPRLTPRQKEVLDLLVAGKSNKEIARSLSISESTVKIHVAAIFRVLGVRNRVEAVKAAQAREL